MASKGPTSRGPRQSPSGVRLFAALCFAVVTCLIAVVFLPVAKAATDLPALSGRVVDNAGLLSAASQSGIESKLKSLEDKSGIQLVVATVKTLGGNEIEPYANQLFRAWKLGEKTKNNGVLLLVAPTEHKVRIEVGYGLEGTLTDATSKLIILNAVTPRFKAGDYQGGIERGTDDIISVLSTDAAEWKKRPDLQVKQDDDSGTTLWFAVVFVIGFVILVLYLQRKSRRGGMVFFPPGAGSSSWGSGSGTGGSSGGSSSSGDSGGFSGGGGSSGGGGASGDW